LLLSLLLLLLLLLFFAGIIPSVRVVFAEQCRTGVTVAAVDVQPDSLVAKTKAKSIFCRGLCQTLRKDGFLRRQYDRTGTTIDFGTFNVEKTHRANKRHHPSGQTAFLAQPSRKQRVETTHRTACLFLRERNPGE